MSKRNNSSNVILLVGTRKGCFVFRSNQNRDHWTMSDLLFKSWNVTRMILDPRNHRLHAAVVHDVYGPSTHYSDDFGETWTQATEVPAFPRPAMPGRPLGTPDEVQRGISAAEKPEKVIKIWEITPGRISEPGLLYAGIEPAALFKSTDNGDTWQLNESLYDHPHRPNWFPGAGGLGLHTILLDPNDRERMFVAISTGGCYRSDDNGLTWVPRNKNVRADFLPTPEPEYGHCVHSMVMHPENPQIIYQQNHCGVYRTNDAGDNWMDIGEGALPSRFGFPIAIHPHNPDILYIVPEESDEYRFSIDGKFTVWRTQDGGDTWEPLTNGLPQTAYLVILRQALSTDNYDPVGVYVGTSTGQLFCSKDGGDHWDLLADFLPPILSVKAAML
jgi:hypothetical protein